MLLYTEERWNEHFVHQSVRLPVNPIVVYNQGFWMIQSKKGIISQRATIIKRKIIMSGGIDGDRSKMRCRQNVVVAIACICSPNDKAFIIFTLKNQNVKRQKFGNFSKFVESPGLPQPCNKAHEMKLNY